MDRGVVHREGYGGREGGVAYMEEGRREGGVAYSSPTVGPWRSV